MDFKMFSFGTILPVQFVKKTKKKRTKNEQKKRKKAFAATLKTFTFKINCEKNRKTQMKSLENRSLVEYTMNRKSKEFVSFWLILL
jgi:hypothetical protein